MSRGGQNLITRIYEYVAVPFALIAGPYYASQLIAGMAPFFLAAYASFGFAPGPWATSLQLSTLVFGTVASCFVLWFVRARRYKTIISHSLNPGIEILGDTFTYYVGVNSYEYKREIRIRPFVDGITHFRNRIAWSGLHNVQVIDFSGAKTVNFHCLQTTSDDAIVYEFEEPLRIGEEKVISSKIKVEDPNNLVRPYYAVHIGHPVRQGMTIRVVFVPARIPKSCERRVYNSRASGSAMPGTTAVLPILISEDGTGQVEWFIPRPAHYRRYYVGWTYGSPLPQT